MKEMEGIDVTKTMEEPDYDYTEWFTERKTIFIEIGVISVIMFSLVAINLFLHILWYATYTRCGTLARTLKQREVIDLVWDAWRHEMTSTPK